MNHINSPSILLHDAIEAGCSDVVELLLDHYTQKDLRGMYLSFCCDPLQNGRGDLVRKYHTLLTEAVCHINRFNGNKTWHGSSTLLQRERIVELLLQKGSLDPNEVPAGKSITEHCLPLMHAITPLPNTNVIKMLLQAGASPLKVADIRYSHLDTHIDDWWNSLHLACSRFGSVEIVRIILDSLNKTNLNGTAQELDNQFNSTARNDVTRLSASWTGIDDITDLVNSRTRKGMTSLMIAASYSLGGIMDKLLLHKADVNAMVQHSCSSQHTTFGGTSRVWESALTLCINPCVGTGAMIHIQDSVPKCVKVLLDYNPWKLRQLSCHMSSDMYDPLLLAVTRWSRHHPAVFEMLYTAGFSINTLRTAFGSVPYCGRPMQYFAWMREMYDNPPLTLSSLLDVYQSEWISRIEGNEIKRESNPLLGLTDRIMTVLHETPSLKQFCRICLRDNLKEGIDEKVKKLNLPFKLQNYLLLSELQTILDEYIEFQMDKPV